MIDSRYEWLHGLTLRAFEKVEKSFSIRITGDSADVFIGQNIRPNSKSILSLTRQQAESCLKDLLRLNGETDESLIAAGSYFGVIKRGDIGDWAYNYGIIFQGYGVTIATVTATMTDSEVKAVQAMAKEHHYELSDLFEKAFDEEIQAELDEELSTDEIQEAINKAKQAARGQGSAGHNSNG